MIGPKVCNRLLERNVNETAADFFKSKLSSIESGCCKPPIASGFQYQNATFWIAPSSCPAVHEDSDCLICMEQSAKHAAHQQRLMQGWGSYAYQVTVQASVYLLSLSLYLQPHHVLRFNQNGVT